MSSDNLTVRPPVTRVTFDRRTGPVSALVKGPIDDADAILLLLHPANLQARSWSAVLESLDDDIACIAPDLRGHGCSPRSGPFGVQEWAEDTRRLVDALDARRVHVVGSSVGAAIAVEFAVQHPDTTVSLAAFGGGLFPRNPADDPLRTAVEFDGPEKALRLAVSNALPEGAGRWITAAVCRDISFNPAETVLAISSAALATDVEPVIDRLRAPCLVVVGALEDPQTKQESDRFCRAVGSELIVLPDVGHLAMYEVPKRVASLISEQWNLQRNAWHSSAGDPDENPRPEVVE